MLRTIGLLPNTMGWVVAMAAVALSAASGPATDQEVKPLPVRTIDLDGLARKTTRGVATRPTRITSAEELAQAFPDLDQKGLDRIAAQVDFAQEELLFFAWTGSNTDSLAVQVEQTARGPVAVFRFEPGRGEDMPHARFRMYAVAKRWRVESPK